MDQSLDLQVEKLRLYDPFNYFIQVLIIIDFESSPDRSKHVGTRLHGLSPSLHGISFSAQRKSGGQVVSLQEGVSPRNLQIVKTIFRNARHNLNKPATSVILHFKQLCNFFDSY